MLSQYLLLPSELTMQTWSTTFFCVCAADFLLAVPSLLSVEATLTETHMVRNTPYRFLTWDGSIVILTSNKFDLNTLSNAMYYCEPAFIACSLITI